MLLEKRRIKQDSNDSKQMRRREERLRLKRLNIKLLLKKKF
jgi:hypothetical protein